MKKVLICSAVALVAAVGAGYADPSAPSLPNSTTAAPQVPANQRQPSRTNLTKSPSTFLPKSPITGKSPVELASDAPLGSINNPLTGDADAIAAGKHAFEGKGCPGCHGGNGGGGICPPNNNDIWVYGSDDDTLFRLIAVGTPGIQSEGFVRVGMENVVAPMPPFGSIIKDDKELFQILAYIRSFYKGAADRINW